MICRERSGLKKTTQIRTQLAETPRDWRLRRNAGTESAFLEHGDVLDVIDVCRPINRSCQPVTTTAIEWSQFSHVAKVVAPKNIGDQVQTSASNREGDVVGGS
jgi:hypothetical protein